MKFRLSVIFYCMCPHALFLLARSQIYYIKSKYFHLFYVFLYTAAPRISPPSSTSNITTVAGTPLTLSCTSVNSPPDTFTWRKDNGPIINSTSITTLTHNNTSAVFRAYYFINSVTTSDSGTYTCIVTNPIGTDNKTINVTVTGMWTHSVLLYLHFPYIL